ncbi:RING-H2 finger protein ATL67-like [Zingiber officinale]|uniref:RING-H2 finger protein ATL67-like n=1 Tax=Zingiber officinale TaxID=94328 RepID=UPI001C4C693A|nr:RING-H2 finger protein ATL67-like [Zingiber officinale]XP_042459351.1 RING-H2 finger protein ATL67-like [Zingiber officinale]
MSAASSAATSSSSLLVVLPRLLAIALFLLLLFTLLAFYLCLRRRRLPNPNLDPLPNDSITLPRIIFVAEDDADGGRASGLDQAAISSYPKFPFAAAKGGDPLCSICLCEYREGEMLRMLPDCGHCFHLLCVDVWLQLNASCPVCRNSPLPTPVQTPISTPLSELAPLAQFVADRRRR